MIRLKVLRNGSLILVGMSVSSEMSEILVAVAPKPGLENVKFVGYVICQNIVQLGDAVEQNLTVLEEAEALVARTQGRAQLYFAVSGTPWTPSVVGST